MESPHWKRGALFIVYDEWGGFFDHVVPPRVPDGRENGNIDLDFGQMGFRIPAVCISPWVKRHHVDHGVYGFESILRMIRYRYGLKALTRRDRYARNIARSFDFESKPRLHPPGLPDPPAVISAACGVPAAAASSEVQAGPARPKEHDLAAMLHSGFLERVGFKYHKPTPARVFRHPSKLGLHP
jgi:phospholipase C